MRRTTPMTSTLALAIAIATPTAALAQDTAPTTADTAAPANDSGVEEIVVTAQRRSENLQDVPLSVATVDRTTLAAINAGGADVRGLSGRVPSLNIESSFGRTFPRFYIRGLGNTDFDLNASQPVSLVYDDVVLENPILKGFPAFDVNRVEVLRGPQGTLFGRNTPAGIVKFDTARPGSGRSYAKISYGTYSTINAEGALDAEITDKVAVRVSGLWQHRGDWIDNLDQPGDDDLEGYDDIALRAQVQFKPTDALTIRLTGQLRDIDGDARVFRANAITPAPTILSESMAAISSAMKSAPTASTSRSCGHAMSPARSNMISGRLRFTRSPATGTALSKAAATSTAASAARSAGRAFRTIASRASSPSRRRARTISRASTNSPRKSASRPTPKPDSATRSGYSISTRSSTSRASTSERRLPPRRRRSSTSGRTARHSACSDRSITSSSAD